MSHAQSYEPFARAASEKDASLGKNDIPKGLKSEQEFPIGEKTPPKLGGVFDAIPRRLRMRPLGGMCRRGFCHHMRCR
ncbi:hypothetical protein, partial [Ruegeria sp. HKCCA0370]|uniref:hypothetical protein n=1 Tax=Ruegeria sp. HKCCA0370 TaxID=2682995 RepID=UPI001C2C998E